MSKFLKASSIFTFSLPLDILVAGSAIKGISAANAGAMLFGMIILLVGGLYVFFGASKQNKLPLGVLVIGSIISICSFIALIIGLCLISAPLSYIGGVKLWKKSKK